MKKRIVLIIIAVALVLTAAWLIWCKGINGKEPAEKPLSDEELMSLVSDAVVTVTVGEKHASGVIVNIDDEGIDIVTAGHLMEGYDQGIVTFNAGFVGFANVRYISDNPDVCVLSFKRSDFDEAVYGLIKETTVDAAAYDGLDIDDEVFIIGSAVGTAANVTVGTVKDKDYYVPDFDANMLFIYADTMPGLSGCPVYDRQGKLVAIMSAGSDYGEAVCVKAVDIINCLEK